MLAEGMRRFGWRMPAAWGRMAERVNITVLEAAERLGVSDDTIRRGLEGKGPLRDLLRDAGHKDNTGRWVIGLTLEAIERNRSLNRRHRQLTPLETPLAALAEADAASLQKLADTLQTMADAAAAAHTAEIQRLAEAHAAELARMQEEITRVREAASDQEVRMRADLTAATAKAETAQAELATERTRAAVATAEANGLRERAQKAEERAGRLEADARRPWWRKLIG